MPGPVFGESCTFNFFLAGFSTSVLPQSWQFAITAIIICAADRTAAPARPARPREVAGSPAQAQSVLAC